MFEDGLGGFFLFVGRVTVLTKDAADEDADLSLGGFAEGPIDGDAFANVRK